jgi:hypothetical protein
LVLHNAKKQKLLFMAGRVSNDLYRLVHSLTRGEWNTLLDEVARSHSKPGGIEREPVYLQLIKLLKEQERYDDAKAKSTLGYDGKKDVEWRTLKKDAFSHIMSAIERTRGNRTKRNELHFARFSVQKLIEKELWTKADRLVDRFIRQAEEYEEFEILVLLLHQKQYIVSNSFPQASINSTLDAIQKQRAMAREKSLSIETWRDRWYQVTVLAKRNDRHGIEKLLESKEFDQPRLDSVLAAVTYHKIKRRAAFVSGDLKRSRAVCMEGIRFCQAHLDGKENNELIELYLSLTFELARINVQENRLDEVLPGIELLKGMAANKSIPEHLAKRATERRLLLELLHCRYRVDRDLFAQAVREAGNWIDQQRDTVSEDFLLRISLTVIDAAMIFGKYSIAAKWAFRARLNARSAFKPRISSAIWLIYLVIRFEQEDWELLKTQLSATKSYLKKFEAENEYYDRLFSFVSSVTRAKGKIDTALSEETKTDLDNLSQKAEYAGLDNYFPFRFWLQAKIEQKDFADYWMGMKSKR